MAFLFSINYFPFTYFVYFLYDFIFYLVRVARYWLARVYMHVIMTDARADVINFKMADIVSFVMKIRSI